MENPELSVVIPAYLEEENLRLLLPRLVSVLEAAQPSFEVLVVDSQQALDDTANVCRGVGHGVIHCARDGGNSYGDAVRTGIARSRGRYILFMDADGSHTPEFVPRILEQKDRCDVVVASRYTNGGATENPASLIWMSKVLNLAFRFVLRIPCKDVSNSFKLYRAELLKPLRLDCNHFDIVEELLVRCMVAKRPLTIVEVPFVFKSRMFGMTKRNLLPFVFSFFLTLLRLFAIKVRASRQLGSRGAAGQG